MSERQCAHGRSFQESCETCREEVRAFKTRQHCPGCRGWVSAHNYIPGGPSGRCPGLPAPEVQAAIHRVVAAFDRCDSNRGRFSCTPAHDGRCEKERGLSGSCTCGSDELEAAMAALAALDRKGT